MSNLECTPSASKNKPMANMGREERLELVRISLAPEDIKRPLHGQTLFATLEERGSQWEIAHFFAAMGRPR